MKNARCRTGHKRHYHLTWNAQGCTYTHTNTDTHIFVNAWNILSLERYLWNYKKKELSDCREGKSETNFSQREFFSTQNFELCSHITYMKIKWNTNEISLNWDHLSLDRHMVKMNLWKENVPKKPIFQIVLAQIFFLGFYCSFTFHL